MNACANVTHLVPSAAAVRAVVKCIITNIIIIISIIISSSSGGGRTLGTVTPCRVRVSRTS